MMMLFLCDLWRKLQQEIKTTRHNPELLYYPVIALTNPIFSKVMKVQERLEGRQAPMVLLKQVITSEF